MGDINRSIEWPSLLLILISTTNQQCPKLLAGGTLRLFTLSVSHLNQYCQFFRKDSDLVYDCP